MDDFERAELDTFGKRLAWAHDRSAYTNARELAEAIGLTTERRLSTISEWRTDKHTPSGGMMLRLIEVLDNAETGAPINPQWLLSGKGDPYLGLPTRPSEETERRVRDELDDES